VKSPRHPASSSFSSGSNLAQIIRTSRRYTPPCVCSYMSDDPSRLPPPVPGYYSSVSPSAKKSLFVMTDSDSATVVYLGCIECQTRAGVPSSRCGPLTVLSGKPC